MPPDGSRPEEAPSRISREIIPGSIREARHTIRSKHPALDGRTSRAISFPPGVSNGRFPNTRPPVRLRQTAGPPPEAA
jgi:hypothetical protein